MPFLLAEILNFQGSTHRTGVGSFSNVLYYKKAVSRNEVHCLRDGVFYDISKSHIPEEI